MVTIERFLRLNRTNALIRFLYPQINIRLITPFLFVIIITAGIGVFIVTRLVTGSIQERFNNQLISSAEAASNSIVEVERQYLKTLRLMVFTQGVADAVTTNDTEKLDLWLRPIAANADVDELLIFDRNGQGLIWLSRNIEEFGVGYMPNTPLNVQTWTGAMQAVSAQPDNLGDKFVDIIQLEDRTVIFFSAPIRAEDSTLVGGVSAGISTQQLSRKIEEQALASTVLYDSNGRIIGTTFRAGTQENLNLSDEQFAMLSTSVATATMSPIQEITLDDVPFQLLYAPFKLRSNQVGLLGVGLSARFLVERTGSSRDSLGTLFAILFILVGVMGLLVSRSITQPIARMVATTRAIRDGDLERRVKLHTPDELGELSQSFDHMTDQLVKRNKQIRRLYLQQLQQTAQREAVLTSISDIVIVQNPEAQIILKNNSAEKLFDTLSHHRALQERVFHLLKQPQELSQPKALELLDQFFSVISTPVQMPSGDLLGYVIIFRDITALVQSERLKDELILQMSHELRTPLATVRGYVDLVRFLDTASLSEQSKSYLNESVLSLDVLERLVNQVIDVSSIIADQFQIEREEFNLADLLRDAAAFWQVPMKDRNLEFQLSVSEQHLPVVGDGARMEQVVNHLLRNAYNYTLPGGSVALVLSGNHDKVHIKVIDTGVGIAPDEISHVFDRMYRGKAAEAGPTDSRGMGLGLYLSKYIIEAHGGRITIESKLNLGTVVHVEIPRH
jgi:signal transduction histidine kinase